MSKLDDWLNSLTVQERDQLKIPFQDVHTIGRELDKLTVSLKISNVSPVTYGLLANVKT